METEDSKELSLWLSFQTNYEKEFHIERNLDKFSKLDLFNALKEAKTQSFNLQQTNLNFEESIADLKRSLEDQKEKCIKLEKDKSFLRHNIKKASASWFERKAKLSESENECSSPEPTSPEPTLPEPCDTPSTVNETNRNSKDGVPSFIADETIQLFADLKYKDEQLQLSETRSAELTKRLNDYEKVINDQEVVIHGLENQLDTYFNDNQQMSKQLDDVHKLFNDLEAINEKKVNVPETSEDSQSNCEEQLPTYEEFREMSGSVAKTYMKLKELIYEKKSLVTEIERLKTLNVELQSRVSQQETRLINVSHALQTTWLLVSNIKDEHEKIHTAETILRYELREKREVLNRLKEELECSREQWQFIRQMNSETEQEWTNLREELDERRKLRRLAELNGNPSITQEEIESVAGFTKSSEVEFEPPVDLLVNMGIEYGVVNADDEEPITAIALLEGEDVNENRLQDLEDQCCFLYQKLMTSTARALTLASRLTSLHEHYALSDDEYEEDSDEENEQYFENVDEYDTGNPYETELLSPDSESHDTAYVSEAEGGDSTPGTAEVGAIGNEDDNELTEITAEESEDLMEDHADLLSRRLINFLPKKIELLRADNAKLEEKLKLQQEEKAKIEDTLNAAVESERRQRRQLEQQLSHLGKCVDELKLERNGKIAEVEDKLKKKIEQVEKEEKEHVQLRNEMESLKEKYDERGMLLQLTASQLEETASKAEEKLAALQEEIQNIRRRNASVTSQSCQTDSHSIQNTNLPNSNDSNNETGVETQQRMVQQRLNSDQKEATRHNEQIDRNYTLDGQTKQLIILTNCCLRIPFHLSEGSILCWSCCVAPQEIVFSLCFENTQQLPDSLLPLANQEHNSIHTTVTSNTTSTSRPQLSSLSHLPIQSSTTYQLTCGQIRETRSLLDPIIIRASSQPTIGRIVAKISGDYSLIFQNSSQEIQKIAMNVWLERISNDMESSPK